MYNFLSRFHPEVQAAIIAAVVALVTTILATPLRYFIDRLALRHKLKTEYEYEQRKVLRQLIGRYHGRMLEAAEALNHRLWNLYENQGKGWLEVGGDYADPESPYYFRTTVYRFLNFCSLSRLFEREAVFVDGRIAEETDLDFLKFQKALRWALTDVALFDDLKYDRSTAKDHFFADQLREICDGCFTKGEFLSLEQFKRPLEASPSLEQALQFFDGLRADEPRFRWDRMVAFHLLLMSFINTFGHDMQRSTKEQFEQVAGHVRHGQILANLYKWIGKLGLGRQREVRHMTEVITRREG